MKLLYTNENRLLVNNVLNLVESAGIAISLKNEYAGGAGDIPPHETWLEVWVENEDFERALFILESSFSEPSDLGWECQRCGEFNDTSFEYCWSCQAPAGQ